MKKFFISIIIISAAFTGCSTDLDINRNPDALNPDSAPLSAQLPAGIAGLAGSEGASYAIIGGFWAQFWTQSNAANQYKDIDNYSIGTSDYNYAWDGMYDALGDIRNVRRRALEESNWKYYLIATTLEVQASQIMTDFYGSVPYSEANDKEILEPSFDTGEQIYDQMIVDLNDALAKDVSVSVGQVPGADDFIFGGDMDKWTQFANTLKLKIYMRQTESSRSAIADAGITALLASGVTFLNEDAAMTQFIDEINQSNPLFEFNNRRLNVATNLRMSRTLSSLLIANGDPRRDAYYTAGNALNQGDFNNAVGAGTIAIVDLHPTTPVLFMSKEESLFLQAEAALRYNGGTGAQALYEAGVNANFARYGLSSGGLLTGAYAYPAGTFSQNLEAIITQKWIASFPGNGFEAFFDKNRTGFPVFSPVYQTDAGYVPGQWVYSLNGVTGGTSYPQRIVYPLSERNANTNAPALVPITTPVWWANN
jgi:hypothetical protein